MTDNENKKLDDGLNEFLSEVSPEQTELTDKCKNNECTLKSKDGLIERVRINKQVIVEDGRQLLM